MKMNKLDTKILAAFWIDVLDEIPGKKAFQKLVYFGQVLGLPFKNPYKMHYFGPYSELVAEELSRAEDLHIIENNGSSYKFLAGREMDMYIEHNYEDIKSNIEKLALLVEYFGDMRPLELELYATTHYIDNNQKLLYNEYNKEKIINKIKEVKGEKFTLEEIELAYNQLEEWSLLYKPEPMIN